MNKYLIDPGSVLGLRENGKDQDLCKVEIIEQFDEGGSIALQVKTYWERKNGISLMRLFPNLLYRIGEKVFRVIYSDARNLEAPYNTVLGFIGEVGKEECNRTFFEGNCIVGCGKYNPTDNYDIFKDWMRLINEVYSEDSKKRTDYTLFPEWNSFQNFAYWYENNKPKEVSPFGKYMMVWDLGHKKNIELNSKTVLFIETNILTFPRTYKYSLETPEVYSMKVNEGYLKTKNIKNYTVLYYSYETSRIESLGTFKTLEEAREVYLLHLTNKKTRIYNYLKSKGNPELEPLISKFERL